MTDPTPKRRWFHPTPSSLIVALVVVEGLLWQSDRFHWPTWHKGYAVLISVAAVAVVFVVMLLWLIVAFLFRLRYQFSIRSLLVLTVTVAVPCSWISWEMKAAKRHKEAVEAIEKVGGMVSYDDETGVPFFARLNPRGLVWLHSLLGEDFFNDAIEAYPNGIDNVFKMFIPVDAARDEQNTNTALQHLDDLPRLQRVVFDGTVKVTDAALVHLEGLTHLQDLSLGGTEITDGGLEHLEGLTQLHTLYLDGTQVTDAGLVRLEKLSELHELNLHATNVTKKGVNRLQQALPNCEIEYDHRRP